MTPEPTYEWGVVCARVPNEVHRDQMTEEQAREWVREFEDEGGKAGAFLVIRRPVGDWEIAPCPR